MNVDNTLLERMLDISRHMAETRNLDPLLDYAMDEAIRLVGAERGYLVLLNKDGSLNFCVQRGLDAEGGQDQVSTSILNKVISTSQPLVIRNATEDSTFARAKSVVELKIRSVMCVPLIARGEKIGAIYVENRSVKGRFNEEDLAPLIFFANQAAVLIENAALNDDLEAHVAERTRELEQAMNQLERSWTESVEANRLRTLFLGNLAHDLRAPLSIVVSALTMLEEGAFGDLQPDQSEWIHKALNAANHVLRLTNDVLDLSKIEMGGLHLYPQEVDLKDFLESIYDVAHGLPWPKTVELALDIRSPLPAVILDPVRIRQVVLNLVTNAMKFTSEGSVTIHAEYVEDDDQVLLGVADTGEGIPPDKMDLLFGRFQQIDTNDRRRATGTGLGLAICRELVEMHGGRIWAESKLGVGSDFLFTLPVDGPPKA